MTAYFKKCTRCIVRHVQMRACAWLSIRKKWKNNISWGIYFLFFFSTHVKAFETPATRIDRYNNVRSEMTLSHFYSMISLCSRWYRHHFLTLELHAENLKVVHSAPKYVYVPAVGPDKNGNCIRGIFLHLLRQIFSK